MKAERFALGVRTRQMKMVVHQHVGVEHAPVICRLSTTGRGIARGRRQLQKISVAPVAAAGDMINGVRKIDPWWARHAVRIPSTTANCKPIVQSVSLTLLS